jgi:hypothetical protein
VRIGIDARLLLAKRTGIGNYTSHLLQSFADITREDEFVLFTDTPVPLPGSNFTNEVIGIKKRILWTLFFLPLRLRSRPVDLFHGTANFELPPTRRCRLVSTVHDLIPLHFPELVSRKFYLLFRALIGRTIRMSDRVITDSEYSRRDILDRFQVPEDRVTVIPLAPHPRFRADGDPLGDDDVRRRYGLHRRCILSTFSWPSPVAQDTGGRRLLGPSGVANSSPTSDSSVTCPTKTSPPSTGKRTSSSFLRSMKASACRLSRRWPAAPRCSPPIALPFPKS